ncbi:dihydroorotate dehydrogenase [Candidatus Bathyarchaeota archaeon]|nr:dihydroorotate dehydrogenase [Candidatus Bathyarchaeota archaeon]
MGSKLSVEIAKLKLRNPVMLAAGILGISGLTLTRVVEAGVGAIVTKSIGPMQRVGFSNPTIVEVDCGFLNGMGLPNPGVDAFIEELKVIKKSEVPVIVSIFGFTSQQFETVATKVVDAGADAVELNISCPHVNEVGEIGQNPQSVKEVVKRVKSVVSKPVFTKLSPNVTDVVKIAKAAAEAGTDAITAVNTLRAMAIDIETGRPILASKIGGLSGPAIKPIAVRCVYEISKHVDVPVVGCGGISNWQDAVEFILAGASAIQIGTAVAYYDFNVFHDVIEGIQAYLVRKGYGSVEELIGASHKY